jgi:hypothetical protein
VILLAGFLIGCGRGGHSGNGSHDGDSGGAKKESDEAVKKGAPKAKKIALGTVKTVESARREVILNPSTDVQGEEPIPFKIAKKATVTLNNEEVELADVKVGQQAQITYIVRNEVNLARKVALISSG